MRLEFTWCKSFFFPLAVPSGGTRTCRSKRHFFWKKVMAGEGERQGKEKKKKEKGGNREGTERGRGWLNLVFL